MASKWFIVHTELEEDITSADIEADIRAVHTFTGDAHVVIEVVNMPEVDQEYFEKLLELRDNLE